jgi:hypothetical protein
MHYSFQCKQQSHQEVFLTILIQPYFFVMARGPKSKPHILSDDLKVKTYKKQEAPDQIASQKAKVEKRMQLLVRKRRGNFFERTCCR